MRKLLDFLNKNKGEIIFVLICVFAFLSLIFSVMTYFNGKKSEKLADEATKLKIEKAYLEGQLEQQKRITDSLLVRSDKLYVEWKQIPTTNTIKVNLENKYDEKVSNTLSMPSDSAVKFLSKWLSETSSTR